MRETSPEIAIWEGHKFSQEEARETQRHRQRAVDQRYEATR